MENKKSEQMQETHRHLYESEAFNMYFVEVAQNFHPFSQTMIHKLILSLSKHSLLS